MNTIEQTFHDEIEVERIRACTGQGALIFLSVLPFSCVLVFVLWDYAQHSSLLVWFITINSINLGRWIILHFYNKRLNELNLEIVPRVKFILIISGLINGLCWGTGNILFIDPAQPYTLLIMSVAIYFIGVGSIMAWFSYKPAVLAFFIPVGVLLTVPQLLQGNKDSVGLGVLFLTTVFGGIYACVKVGRIYTSALHLNFENVLLRRESEEKSLLLETALENMGQGISMSDKEDRLRMWNKRFTDLLGAAGNKVATNIKMQSILNAANPPIKTHNDNHIEHRLTDGRVFDIRQTKVQQGGRVITYTDISDLIKREKALELARKAAEQANAAKTRFLAAASHDLRQPIHALGLFFAELSDRVQSIENDPLISQVDDSITAINSMLNALLDVSKLDAGVVKPNIENFSLTELFVRLESEFIPIASENQNQLRFHPTAATVHSDSVLLERMLRNLIGNALRYTKNGRVVIAARPRREKVEIQVFDNGPGIPEKQLDEIFIEFHQLGNPSRDRRQGLGLGLAIVKRQASLLQHDLKVLSHPGRGSCFSIIVPLAQALQIEPDKKIVDRMIANSLDGFTVLVLDDDIAVLEGMRGLLTRWGCQVITAATPGAAFDQLNAHQKQPELLIVDYRLPDHVSGIEVAKQLQESLTYSVSVLIITGDTGPERLREAEASGYPLLHKPVQPAKLRTTLQYLLNKQNSIKDST